MAQTQKRSIHAHLTIDELGTLNELLPLLNVSRETRLTKKEYVRQALRRCMAVDCARVGIDPLWTIGHTHVDH